MGQNNSHHSNHGGRLIGFASNNTPPPNYDLPPLKFHNTHGDNIELSADGFTAMRHESFCKGILFR
jgi:protein neuralized